ncbi:MAG: hypothetical protein J0G30_10290 [Actinomycetales bacterium]|nr:hypothetical protein [Actinomycetales bacterium]
MLFLLLGLAGIAGLVLGIAAVLGATILSPETAAQRYLDALAAGRLDEAAQLAPTGAEGEDAALLGGPVLADPAARIAEVAVGAATREGGVATVPVAYTLAGEREQAQLTLVRGVSFLDLAGDWRVAAPLAGTLELPATPTDRVSVNGVDVTTGPQGSAHPVYPGVYTITPARGDDLFALDTPQEVTVAAGATVEAGLPFTATPALTAAVQDAVDAAVAACATSTDRNPVGCPFGIEIFDEYQNLAWSIAQTPAVAVDAAAGTFASDGAGRATASYEVQTYDGRGWEPASQGTAFAVQGTFTVVSGEVSVALTG